VPGQNDWNVSYATIQFVESGLAGHTAVESFTREQDIVFRIARTGRRTPIMAVLINRYVIGQADVMKVMADFPGVQLIFAHGNWCGYTREAKEYGLENDVGVFEMSEFLGALHHSDFLRYAKKDHKGISTHSYKTA
jgi:hypothetical protein